MSRMSELNITLDSLYSSEASFNDMVLALMTEYSLSRKSATDFVESFISEQEHEVYNESMDGDHESALASVGWGTDEDYGYYGDDY